MKLICTFCIIAVCFCYGCEKKKNTAPSSVTTTTPPIDTPKVVYPYTDTFYGPYSETNSDVSPFNYNGYSTVFVTHMSVDSFFIFSTSIGLSRNGSIYSDTVRVAAHINDSGIYSFFVRWAVDRSDDYSCHLFKDSIICNVDQSDGDPANDDYTGVYRGILQ